MSPTLYLHEKKEILAEPLFHKELEQHQMGECAQDKVRLSPETYRTVLVLFDLMEFSHQEIAEVLEISVENVKVRPQYQLNESIPNFGLDCPIEMRFDY